MHVELVPSTEALVAQLTFKWLLTWMGKNNLCQVSDCEVQRITCKAFYIPVCVFRCRSMSFWPYCVLKVQPVDATEIVLLQGVCVCVACVI